jgi:methyl-galactoside transport system permease protein
MAEQAVVDKKKAEESVIASPFETNPAFAEHLKRLEELRIPGEDKVIALNSEIKDVKLNKQIDKETKAKIVGDDRKAIADARVIRKQNAGEVKKIVKESLAEAKTEWVPYYQNVKAAEKTKKDEAKALFDEKVAHEKSEHEKRLAQIESEKKGESKEDLEAHKIRVRGENIYHKAQLGDITSAYRGARQKSKDTVYEAYLEKYAYQGKVHNNRHSPLESFEFWARHYAYAYDFRTWLLKNALYIIILIFYIYCVIASDGVLISTDAIRNILSQSSTKMFFSLGVAGLILIAGTDLSIGRMTGMAATFACMFLGVQGYSSTLTNIHIDTTGWSSLGSKVLVGMLVCILVCTLFSAVAGFFSARFKMHPFITTLSTQLLMYGWMELEYSVYPAVNTSSDIVKPIVGKNDINLIIYAAIGILVMWFIWNKTKFGKNMYAVGGNAEAASVSGINVFATTLAIFVMAGVYYGIGGFLEGARVTVANPNTGTGTELDAIAACVVGGISFSGGVGKVSGAVIGTIIFTGMTYCLYNIGVSPFYQYIFKGIIIMAAVCLDSIKYLKKK